MRRVQDAFGTLIWIVAAVAAVIAIFTLAPTGKSYCAIGGAGLAPDDEDNTRARAAERDEEIREHVVARNARRVRAGDRPLDVEAEIERQLRELT
jgi:hypothetical protein